MRERGKRKRSVIRVISVTSKYGTSIKESKIDIISTRIDFSSMKILPSLIEIITEG